MVVLCWSDIQQWHYILLLIKSFVNIIISCQKLVLSLKKSLRDFLLLSSSLLFSVISSELLPILQNVFKTLSFSHQWTITRCVTRSQIYRCSYKSGDCRLIQERATERKFHKIKSSALRAHVGRRRVRIVGKPSYRLLLGR